MKAIGLSLSISLASCSPQVDDHVSNNLVFNASTYQDAMSCGAALLETKPRMNNADYVNECADLGPPTEMIGVAVVGMEHVVFYDDAQDWTPDVQPEQQTWLEVDKTELAKAALRSFEDSGWQAFKVRLIGRKSRKPGGYGHVGMYKHLIMIDRLISAVEIKSIMPS